MERLREIGAQKFLKATHVTMPHLFENQGCTKPRLIRQCIYPSPVTNIVHVHCFPSAKIKSVAIVIVRRSMYNPAIYCVQSTGTLNNCLVACNSLCSRTSFGVPPTTT